jgi:hypothetical protein
MSTSRQKYLRRDLPLLLSFSSLTICSTLLCAIASAAPVIESIHFVSGVQSGDRTCDLTYRVLVRGDDRPYRAASINVSAVDAALTILNGTVAIQEIDSDQLLLTSPFTARYDVSALRKQKIKVSPWCPEPGDDDGKKGASPPISLSSFSLTFAGQLNGTSSTAGSMRIGELSFLEGGGRPGHEGTFPIQGDSPPAGAALAVLANIFGGANSASYQFIDASGIILTSGTLSSTGAASGNAFYASGFLIPFVPFRVAISALDPLGNNLTWQSRLYNPASIAVRIVPVNDTISPGQTINVGLQVASARIKGRYVLNLYLPPGLTNKSGPLTIDVAPGTVFTAKAVIAVDSSVPTYTELPVIVEATGLASTLPTVSANFTFRTE